MALALGLKERGQRDRHPRMKAAVGVSRVFRSGKGARHHVSLVAMA
jgi:hypothetical protein